LNILVTGGAGYIGSWLVPHLLADGHNVVVVDTMTFGTGHLPDNPNLKVIKADVVMTQDWCFDRIDTVIYLAGLSNNVMCEQDLVLSVNVNVRSLRNFVKAAKANGVGRFIYASSVAVYGSSDEDSFETDALVPTTPYAVQKAMAEEAVMQEASTDFNVVITRSASVCGYSPNMAFHLTVNMMTNHAFHNRRITVNGGQQKRCHIHIQDVSTLYRRLLTIPVDIPISIYNFVAQNMTVLEAAQDVRAVMDDGTNSIQLVIGPATDDRSYTVDGSWTQKRLGWSPEYTVKDAVWDMKVRFQSHMWGDSMTNEKYGRITQNGL